MAKKKKPKAETIGAPSGKTTSNVAGNAVETLSGAASTGNTESGLDKVGSLLQLWSGTSGALALNPQLRAEFDATTKSVEAALKKPTQELGKVQTEIANLQSKSSLTNKQRERLNKLTARATELQSQVSSQNQRLTDLNTRLANEPRAQDTLRNAFPELQATADAANPYLDRMGQLGATGERLMGALGQGYRANEIRADQVQAARMRDFGQATSRDISAGQVGAGTLGQSLMQRAQQMAQSDGRLSPEANRDAVQAARQAFAARGLGTSAGSAAAELLNRDQYSRQRMFQDLGFAQGVQAQDLGRQFQNVGNQLAADQSNQSAALQAEMANLEARYNAAVQQGNWEQAAAIQNQGANLQAAVANEEARRLGNQMNIGMLGQAFTTDRMVNQEGLGAVLQRGQLQGAANPNNMLLNLFNSAEPTGSQSISAGGNIGTNWANNQVQTDTFNANAKMWTDMANKYGNYGGMQSSLTGSPLGDFALNKGVDIGTKILFG
jgi:hypothetical protein